MLRAGNECVCNVFRHLLRFCGAAVFAVRKHSADVAAVQRCKLFSFLHGHAGLVLHVNRRFAFLRRAHGENLCTRADCRQQSVRRKHRKDEKRACRRLFNDLQKFILGDLRHGIFRKNAVDVDIRFLRLFVCVADDFIDGCDRNRVRFAAARNDADIRVRACFCANTRRAYAAGR